MRTSGPLEPGLNRHRFVGRASEFADLCDDLRRLPHPLGPMRILRGAPGVGKTRLAEELSRHAAADGVAVAWGRSAEDVGAPPYWLWTQVVRSLAGRSGGVDLAGLVMPDASTVERFELFDAVADTIRRAAIDEGLLVVLDDLHTADPATLQLTRFLARQLTDAPLLVVATVRSGPVVGSVATEHLDALSRLGFTRDITGVDVGAVADLIGDVDHARSVHAVTGGNPLFVHEVARSVEVVVDGIAPVSADEMERALRASLSERIRRVDEDARRVLDAAAVLGFEIDRHELAGLAEPLDPVTMDDILRRLDADGFLSDTDPVRFRHPLPAAVLRDELAEPARRELHRRAAAVIGSDPTRAGEVAHHLLHAGPDHVHAGVVAARHAAEAATASTAHEVAVTVLSRAADVVDVDRDGDLRLDVLLDLGAALWRAGRTAEADDVYEQAWSTAETLGDADSLARAVLRNGVDYYFADNVRQAIVPRVERALAAQPPGDSAVQARLLAEFATHHLARQRDLGRDAAHRAVEMARRLDDPLALGNALIARQVTDLGPRTLARRIVDAHEILACARDSGDYRLAVHGRFLLMGALLEAGDIGGVDGELTIYDGVTDDLGEPRYDRFSLWLRATRAMLEGDTAVAEDLASRSLEISVGLDDPDAFGVYGGQVGVLLWMQDRVQEMEPVYSDLRAAEPLEPLWPSVLAWIAATHGEVDAARGALAAVPDPTTIPSGMHWLLTATTYAETAALVGSDEQVDAAWNALVPFADRMVPIAMGAAVWGTVAKPLGHLAIRRGEVDDGLRYLRTAVHTCARLGARPWMIEAQLDLADALHRHRPHDPAIAVLRSQAHASATRLGLGLFLRRIDTAPSPTLADASPPSGAATDEATTQGRPRVRIIGGFEVVAATGATARWTSRKARELLKILVSRRGAPVGREVLMDVLWPGEEPETLSNRLSVALSTVRRALDPDRIYPASELVSAVDDAVALNLDIVAVDAEELIDGVRRLVSRGAELASDSAMDDAVALLDAHRGEALPDEPHSDWASGLRDEVRAAMVRLARAVAAGAEAGGDHLGAVAAHRRVLDLDPYDEAAHSGLVAAFTAIGAHGQAATASATYRERLAELGIDVCEGA